ncbi:MAG: AbrB/MazE/SpoVT family DNA-binding domain-containing protein [Proteobacteria bacterium]|nr:AbrB/MazE/SpoVT family DNA-binding domain-containing protein [Pseudomonadota bacterium]
MEIKATTRKWGNSIAVVIPREIVEKQHIKADEEISIIVDTGKPKAKEFFGLLKGRFSEPTQKIKDEMRRGWETAADRSR